MNTKDLIKLTLAGIIGGFIALAGERIFSVPSQTEEAENPFFLDTGHQDSTNCTKCADSYLGGSTPLEISLPTRAVSNGAEYYLYWRYFKFSADGRLLSIGKETSSVCTYVSNGDSFYTAEEKARRRAEQIEAAARLYQERTSQKKGDTHERKSLFKSRKATPRQTSP